jgi:hypothetical protein
MGIGNSKVMDDGQITPHGYPNFIPTFKIYVFGILDRQTDRWRN